MNDPTEVIMGAHGSSYIPIPLPANASSDRHDEQALNAMLEAATKEFQKENPRVVITSMTLVGHGIYVHWKRERDSDD